MKTKLILHTLILAVACILATKVGKSHLDFNARYVHEFENRKRPEGDLFQFNATLKF